MGARWLGVRVGEERIITFDMGGTSTDVSLIDGEPRLTVDGSLGSLPLRLPMIDIHTVGAGGGSVAWRDRGGALRVGPISAGAVPGPACYGKGDEVTVTDANVFLGRIPADRFLGGTMPLDVDRARAAVERLGTELGLRPERAALGVLRVAEASMERAIRVISLERGEDPSRFVLYSFGGAGGLHVAALAQNLGIPRIRIPETPGLFSALGMLASDVVVQRSETVLEPLGAGTIPRLEERYCRMEADAREVLAAEGFVPAAMQLFRTADLRYRGQSFELNLPFDRKMEGAFHDVHAARRGHAHPGREVEVVHLRLRAVGQLPGPQLEAVPLGPEDASAAVLDRRRVYGEGAAWEEMPVYDRDLLEPGMSFAGPALVTEYSSTLWVPPGLGARVDGLRSLVLRGIEAGG